MTTFRRIAPGEKGPLVTVSGARLAWKSLRDGGARRLLQKLGDVAGRIATKEARVAAAAAVRSTFGRSPDLPIAPMPVGPFDDRSIAALRFDEVAKPAVSIVVPVYDHVDATLGCLASLVRVRERTSAEIIVVDDGSKDETERLLPRIAGLRYVRNSENLGFIGACNRGAEIARGEYVCFLNNDTQVLPGWLDEAIATFEREPRAGLVGSQLLYPDGRLQESGGIVWRDASGMNVGRLGDPEHPDVAYLREVDYCSGAAIFLRTAFFRELGGFDRHYAPAYYEDTDLAFRVRRAGKAVFVQPLSRVVHFEGVTSGTDVTKGVKRYQVVNREKFFARWRDVLAAEHFPPGTNPLVAKDRGAGPRLLFVDTFIPRPDHDSGSVRLRAILRIAREVGFHVTFAPEVHLRGAVGAYSDLQRSGIAVVYPPFVPNVASYLRARANQYDVIVLARHRAAARFIPQIRALAPRAKIGFDTVDLHFRRHEHEARVSGSPKAAAKAARTKREELRAALEADFTIVVSDVEAQILARECPSANVLVLSNIHVERPSKTPFFARRDVVFVGGFLHPPNVDGIVHFVRGAWPKIEARVPDARLVIVGPNAPSEVRALARERIVVTGHVPDLDPIFESARVSVAPLRYGAGVKGKVNTAMSYGVPVVATSVAVEGMALAPGEQVLVADDDETTADAVVRLWNDEALWRKLAEGGRRSIREHFSEDAARATIRRIYDSVARR